MPSIIDISLPIYPGMITYPDNPQVEIERIKGASTFRSKIIFGSHAGTHIDAPRHISENGIGVDSLPLDVFIGTCRVLDLTSIEFSREISADHLAAFSISKGDRILAKTRNSLRGFDKFYEDYVALSGEAAEMLAKKNVALFGIDSLGIKKRGATDNRAHTALLSKNIPILEGLDLSAVPAGEYTLITMPLRFVDLDGAPARAVLIKNSKFII